MYKKIPLILILLCSINACVSSARPKEAPNENQVESKNILVIPPHFKLKEPDPEIQVVIESKKKSIFSKKVKDSNMQLSEAEQEIINKIQGKTKKIDKEKSNLTQAEKTMLDKLNKL